ncbi:MAG TPA: DEAD/DEAH box helicase [Pyrinomonadaceae bacterium]|nr:DEAD/DEAH box helicase [Pyrinomonadaceae bacterium]
MNPDIACGPKTVQVRLTGRSLCRLIRIMQLRPYQATAVDAVFEAWTEHDSTLVVCPTGTGKTITFCEIIRRMQPQRAIVLAHRSELITQAVRKLWGFGIEASIEMADQYANEQAWERAPVVVSTVQTQNAGRNGKGRMSCFDPYDFGLVVADEAHHYTAASFRRVLDYYRKNPNLKILGVTATPDRADEEALGQVFQSVAYDYEILDAINDGWLVPVEQQMVNIEGLDFSHVGTTRGDLNGADLAAVMEAEQNLQGVAGASIEIIGNRQTLAFTVSVKQAERLAEIFNRHRPGMADWVCGETPKDKRFKILQDFSQRKIQVLCNVGVLTEGYDEAGVEVIVQARPTKSRCLYAQIIGRALRPLGNLVDAWEEAEDRKIAIAESPKPAALILDFVGNSGKHKLMTTADILGGKVSEAAVERAVERAKREGRPVDMARELEEAEAAIRREEEERRQREMARRAKVVAKAQFSVHTVSPFDVFHLTPMRERGWHKDKVLSEKQRGLLLKQGIDPDGMPYAQAKQIIDHQFYRWKNNLCSIKQAALLQKHGYVNAQNFTRDEASRLISQLANNGWRRVA